MKKKQNKFTHLRIPILNDDYFVDVCWGDKKKILKYLRYKFDDPDIPSWELSDDTSRGKTFARKGYNPAIWIALKDNDHHFFATLAHEACHAIDAIWEHIGEKVKDEVFAHSVGAIVATVELKIKKK